MSVQLTINGTDYFYPEQNDVDWGPDATDWAVAVSSGMLQKAGGLFLLLGEVDFGPNYGLVSAYYKSRTVDAATVGSLRLSRTDLISWRNEANSANLSLSLNSSNQLNFNDLPINVVSAEAADSNFINATVSFEADGIQVQVPKLVGDTGSGGTLGLVPAPAAGDAVAGKYLSASGLWVTPPGTSIDGDILQESFTALDDQSTPADITDFEFANGAVRSFQSIVSIVRDSTYAQYTLNAIQTASTWELDQQFVGGDTGIEFSITTDGQIQYVSSATGFDASIQFRAWVTLT